MMNWCLILIFASLAGGCANGTLRVTSKPESADVFVAYEGEQPNKIGQTPLNLDSRNIDMNRGRYLNLTIKKEGFQPETVLVPTGIMKASLDVSTRLEENKLPTFCADQTASVEKIARGVASAQSLLNRKNIEEARGKLGALINEYPDVAVLHDLMGNVNYISKNLDAALASYQRSLNIDPNNIDTQRMVGKLRTILNIREPSSTGER